MSVIETRDNNVYYMDLVDKVFPTTDSQAGIKMKTIDQFVSQITQEMRIREISSKHIFFEMKQGYEPSERDLERLNVGDITKE